MNEQHEQDAPRPLSESPDPVDRLRAQTFDQYAEIQRLRFELQAAIKERGALQMRVYDLENDLDAAKEKMAVQELRHSLLWTDLRTKGAVIRVCAGCGNPESSSRDCGCPAGVAERIVNVGELNAVLEEARKALETADAQMNGALTNIGVGLFRSANNVLLEGIAAVRKALNQLKSGEKPVSELKTGDAK